MLSRIWFFHDPVDCSPPGSSVRGVFQARILEWVAISFSRGSSQLRDWTGVSHIEGRCFTFWATREVLVLLLERPKSFQFRISWFSMVSKSLNRIANILSLLNIFITYKSYIFRYYRIAPNKLKKRNWIMRFSSVQFSRSVMSDSLWPYGLQHAIWLLNHVNALHFPKKLI